MQTLGANGFGYRHEGMTLPNGTVLAGGEGNPEAGSSVPTIRKRYLDGQEMQVEFFDGFKQGQDGKDSCELRYMTKCGIEVLGANSAGYAKRV